MQSVGMKDDGSDVSRAVSAEASSLMSFKYLI